MNLKELIKAKEEKRQKLHEKSEAAKTVEEARSIGEEIKALTSEIETLRSALSVNNEPDGRTSAVNRDGGKEDQSKEGRSKSKGKDDGGIDPENGFASRGKSALDGAEGKESKEARMKAYGKDLREGRSVTVASGQILLPKHESDTINPTFLSVSNLVDSVSSLILPGGESYEQPYEINTPPGTYTEEGAAAADTDMKFGKAEILKSKITAYSEMSEEVQRLPEAPYADVILNGIRTSLRRKLATEIMVGTGTTNTLTGIFSDKATAIDKATDLSIAKIDNTTLDDIIYSYGGDEAVEGNNVLILNKKDLAAFAKLRTTDGHKYHDIRPSGNGGSGTIDGTPYIINSACGAISDGNTAGDAYCMAYGNLSNYQLTIFSEMDIQKSTDYKFKEGMIAHRGVVFAGGNVVSYNGFIRVKKAAAA